MKRYMQIYVNHHSLKPVESLLLVFILLCMGLFRIKQAVTSGVPQNSDIKFIGCRST